MTGEWQFRLNGDELLGYEYDDAADVLYLWRGDGPQEAIGITTADGHVVRVDEETGEVVGFTVFNWRSVWSKRGTPLEIDVPDREAAAGSPARGHHELELIPA